MKNLIIIRLIDIYRYSIIDIIVTIVVYTIYYGIGG